MRTVFVGTLRSNPEWPEHIQKLHRACVAAYSAFDEAETAAREMAQGGADVRPLYAAVWTEVDAAWRILERLTRPLIEQWEARARAAEWWALHDERFGRPSGGPRMIPARRPTPTVPLYGEQAQG